MMLADLGADVIKVESPDGDPYRAYQGGNYSPHFQAYNRNKRSLALDHEAAGRPRGLRHADPRRPMCSSRTSGRARPIGSAPAQAPCRS